MYLKIKAEAKTFSIMKTSGLDSFIGKSYLRFKEEIIPILGGVSDCSETLEKSIFQINL